MAIADFDTGKMCLPNDFGITIFFKFFGLKKNSYPKAWDGRLRRLRYTPIPEPISMRLTIITPPWIRGRRR
jgi:hypothetical protein